MSPTLKLISPGLALAIALLQPVQAESAFDCSEMHPSHKMAAIEGKDGVFFRVLPDLAMWHPVSDQAVEWLAQLSEALAERGIKLVYVPLPTRALAMSDTLPVTAWDYGYDPQIAVSLYEDVLLRLDEVGVANVNALAALTVDPGNLPSFFATDPRLTPDGAGRLAAAISATVSALPEAAGLPKSKFVTRSNGTAMVPSHMREILQRHCSLQLPLLSADVGVTTRVGALSASDASDATATSLGGLNLSDEQLLVAPWEVGDAVPNLGGQLAEASGLSTQLFLSQDGDAFSGMVSYLTSTQFQDTPVKVLVWVNPISESLTKYGDQPMRELIAAAGPACDQDLPVGAGIDSGRLIADLASLDPIAPGMLLIDTGGVMVQQMRVDFVGADNTARSRWVTRDPMQIATRSFYVPADGLWAGGAVFAEIAIPDAFGPGARVAACPAPSRTIAAE